MIGIKKSLFFGLSLGCVFIVMFSSYALAFWYGPRLIAAGELDVSGMMTAFFSVLIGAMSIGNAFPGDLFYHTYAPVLEKKTATRIDNFASFSLDILKFLLVLSETFHLRLKTVILKDWIIVEDRLSPKTDCRPRLKSSVGVDDF